MKKNLSNLLLVFAFTCIDFSCYSQKKYYDSEWNILNKQFKNYGEIKDYLGYKTKVFLLGKNGYIITRLLSKKPSLICLENGYDKSKKNEILKMYKREFDKYVNSKSVEYDLYDILKDNKITTNNFDKFIDFPYKIDTSNSCTYYLLSDLNIFFQFNGEGDFVSYTHLNIPNSVKYNTRLSDFKINLEDYKIGMSISVSNLSEKTIKYITFNTSIYNSVDDKIATKSVKGVGYIFTNDSGTYDFDDLMFSKVADRVEIDSIIIQYNDGTKLTIPKSIVFSITESVFYKEDFED